MIKLNEHNYACTYAHQGIIIIKDLKILYCFKFMRIALTEGRELVWYLNLHIDHFHILTSSRKKLNYEKKTPGWFRKNIVLLLVWEHQGHLATLSFFFPRSFLWWIFNKMTSKWKPKLNGKERMLSGKILNSLLDYLIGGDLFLLLLGTL